MFPFPHFWARRSRARRRSLRVAIAAPILSAALGGCGINVPLGPSLSPPGPRWVHFERWDTLGPDSCRGIVVASEGTFTHIRVMLWYSTTQGETPRVVTPSPDVISNYGLTAFFAPPQVTGGEPRFPRIGEISWDGGTWPAHPRTPEVSPTCALYQGDPYWCWISPDSVFANLCNRGGWAYHVIVTLDTGDTVLDIPTIPDHLGPLQIGTFYSAARESAGVMLLPRITKVRWEDYGGIRDSLVSPVVGDSSRRCY